MAFITRYSKKTKAFALFTALFFAAFATASGAVGGGLAIKMAELVAAEDAYVLNADFDVNFSGDIEAALNKGVPLTFLVEFEIVTPRRYWFDDEVKTASTSVVISYHALSRQYLINRDNHQQSFMTLEEAKDELSHLRDWPVFDKSLLKKGEKYQAIVRIRLDRTQLPKPVQVEAMSSDEWNMLSERYQWTPTFFLPDANTNSENFGQWLRSLISH